MSVRLLMTCAGGALAPLNIKLLKESPRFDCWVLAVDQRPDAEGRYFADAFAPVPGGSDGGYIAAIAELVAKHRIDIVLPLSDEEALALSASRSEIEAHGATLVCVAHETLRTISDKAATYRRLQAAGVALPRWQEAGTKQELAAAVKRFAAEHGEFAVKPARSRGNRGIYVVRTDVSGAAPHLGSREWHADLATFRERFLAEAERSLPALVMERLFPPAYDIDVLAKHGRLLNAVARRRINPAGVPYAGNVIATDKGLLELAESVTAALGLSWLYDFDLMTDRAGRPVLIEVNPRPSGSMAASILAGMPFYDNLIALVRGEVLEAGALRPVMVVPYLDCHILPREAVP